MVTVSIPWLELMRAIKEHPDHNVTMLANLLKRKQEAVSRDLGMLKRFGLVELEKTAKEVTPQIKSTRVGGGDLAEPLTIPAATSKAAQILFYSVLRSFPSHNFQL